MKGRRGRLALVNLQKRLLSSVEAFARTLRRHAATVAPDLVPGAHDDDEDAGAALSDAYGAEDDSADEDAGADDHEVATAAGARELLARLLAAADRHRDAISPRTHALVEWMRRHQCPAVGLGATRPGGREQLATGSTDPRETSLPYVAATRPRRTLTVLRPAA